MEQSPCLIDNHSPPSNKPCRDTSDFRRKNSTLPHPSKYRRPPKLSKRYARTEPELTGILERPYCTGQLIDPLDTADPQVSCISTSSQKNSSCQRSKSIITYNGQPPQSPIIYRPTAMAAQFPVSSECILPGRKLNDHYIQRLLLPAPRCPGTSKNSHQLSLEPSIISTRDCWDKDYIPRPLDVHKKSNSIPTRQLRLASCPEFLRRTLSDHHGDTLAKASPQLHPLSQIPKMNNNVHSLTMLYRKLRGTLYFPFRQNAGVSLTSNKTSSLGFDSPEAVKSSSFKEFRPNCPSLIDEDNQYSTLHHLWIRSEVRGHASTSDLSNLSSVLDSENTIPVIRASLATTRGSFSLDIQALRDMEDFVNDPDDDDDLQLMNSWHHRYTNSLAEALQSILTISAPPDEIIHKPICQVPNNSPSNLASRKQDNMQSEENGTASQDDRG